jgi:hypothetical protein
MAPLLRTGHSFLAKLRFYKQRRGIVGDLALFDNSYSFCRPHFESFLQLSGVDTKRMERLEIEEKLLTLHLFRSEVPRMVSSHSAIVSLGRHQNTGL